LSAKGDHSYGDLVFKADSLVRQDFTNPKMSKIFNPGEVREGIQVYEISKGKPLFDLEIYSLKNSGYSFEKILFSPSIWNNVIFKAIRFLFIYILFLLMLYSLYQQRKKKTDGKVWSSIYVFMLPFFVTFDESFVSSLSNKFFLVTFLGGLLFLAVLNFLISRRVLMDFFCLVHNDKLLLIDEFVKQMQWDNPKISNAHGNITITDPNNKTSYIFRLSNVWVKNPTKDTLRAKKVLLDLYSKSRFDFKSFYLNIALIHFATILYFFSLVFLF
jgi:hypothetical protein